MRSVPASFLLFFAGLCGAAGVAFAAVAAHGTGEVRLMASASQIALVHAAALLGLASVPSGELRFAPLAGLLVAGGVLLFSGDLALRFFRGSGLFEGAAPTGGMLLIVGWLVVAAGTIAAALLKGHDK